MKKAFRFKLWLPALFVVALAGIWWLWATGRAPSSAGASPRERGRVPVETRPVERVAMVDRVRLTGSLRPAQAVTVAPRINGRLESLLVDIGDRVRSGDLIAVLESEEYRQQVIQAEAEWDVARAHLAEARHAETMALRERDRVAVLREQQVASEAEWDAAEARAAAAEARRAVTLSQVRQREAGLETAKLRLSYTRIHAEWDDGESARRVGERHVYPGTMLRAHEPIVSLLEVDRLKAIVHVVERDYPKVAPGQSVTVFAEAFPGERFTGRVARIAPLLHEASRQGRVEVEIANPDGRLRPGMFIRADLVFEERPEACAVPVSSLVRRNGSVGVFQPDPETGRARFVPVQTGLVDDHRVEILAPRLEGDVITLGQHLLEDGIGIRVTRAGDRQEP